VNFCLKNNKGNNETAVIMHERLIEEDKVDFLLPPWGTIKFFGTLAEECHEFGEI